MELIFFYGFELYTKLESFKSSKFGTKKTVLVACMHGKS